MREGEKKNPLYSFLADSFLVSYTSVVIKVQQNCNWHKGKYGDFFFFFWTKAALKIFFFLNWDDKE